MEIYYLIAVSLFGFALTFGFTRGSHRPDRITAAFVVACVGVIALWRKAGTDYQIYTTHYEFLAGAGSHLVESNAGIWEPGFLVLVGLFSGIGLPYDALLLTSVIVSVAICCFVAARAIANVTGFLFALFCLCFLFIPFIRQDLAAALIFLAFHYLVRDRFRLFALTAALALSIHLSAVFIVLVMILADLWRRDRLLHRTTLKAALALPVLAGILGWLLVDPARLAAQATVYVAEGFVQGVVDEQTSAVRNSLKFVFYILIAGLLRIFYRKEIKAEPPLKLAFAIVVAFSVLSALLVQLTPVFSRLSIYLFPFVALVYGGMLRRKGHRKVVCICICSALLLLHFLIAFLPLAKWM